MNQRRLTGDGGFLDDPALFFISAAAGMLALLLFMTMALEIFARDYGEDGQGSVQGVKANVQNLTVEGEAVKIDDKEFIAFGKWVYLDLELTNTTDDDIALDHEYKLLADESHSESSSLNVELTERLNDIQDLKGTELEPGETVEIVGVFDWGNKSRPDSLVVHPENSMKRLHIPLD